MSRAKGLMSEAVTRGLYVGGAYAVSRRLRRQSRALILRYHSVIDDGESPAYIDPGLSVTRSGFDRQMQFLRQRYTPVSLEDVLQAVTEGSPLPPLAVAVTFDDGYRDNHVHAFPLLRKHGIPAAFYITAGCVEEREPLWTSRLRYYFTATRERTLRLEAPRPRTLDLSTPAARHASFAFTIALIKSAGQGPGDRIFRTVESRLEVTDLAPLSNSMMSWSEIEEMGRGGMLIGAHTLTHPNLPGLPSDRAQSEIEGSKSLIEARIGSPVLHFAYPNGRGVSHFNDAVKDMVRKAGFLSSVTSINGPVQSADDPFALKRLGVYRKHAPRARFALDLERTRLAGAGS